jgi:hypothetical protein
MRSSTRRMKMRTGRISNGRAVEGAVLAMTVSMMTARVSRTRRAVRKEPGKGRVQRMGRGKGTEEGNWKGTEEGKGKGNGNRISIVKPTPGRDDISRAVALQLQKDMYEADSDMED